jgi:hypothetical protein
VFLSRGRIVILATQTAAVVVSGTVEAQHADHHHATGTQERSGGTSPPSTTDKATEGTAQSGQPVAALDLVRDASGTAWQPETTPHAAIHQQAGSVELMFHTVLFGGYDYQATDRGGKEPIAVGWIMGMARRRFDNGSLTARVMLSPEPWTAGYRNGGYPLLLQTGETFNGQPLHDRQHPHDLFMEVGGLYTQGVGNDLAVQIYAAPAGEPALGPIAFPHRYSASADPFATLSHHWQDSTHISFGVLTAGVISRRAKLEGSWFNGREPDEKRYNFELRRPDSYAVRVSVAPSPAWSGQVSYGYLASPEALSPDNSVHRMTASVMRDHALDHAGHWAVTAVFGLNKENGESATVALLLEGLVDLDGKNAVFGRAELGQKTGPDLVLMPSLDDRHFVVGNIGLGYLRNVGVFGGFVPGIGVRGILDFVPSEVEPFYGSRVFAGGMIFVRVAIAPMAHMSH